MDRQARILLIEDNEDDAELLKLKLRKSGFDVYTETVMDAESMNAALDSKSWDAIISDFQLPAFNALAALEIVRNRRLDIPFIIVSGTIGEETAVKAMKAGAHDYVMKGNLTRLIPALDRELRESDVRRRRRESETMLQQHEVLLRSVVDIIPVSLGVINNEGNVIISNQAFKKIWGDVRRLDAEQMASFKGWWADSGEEIDPEDWIMLKALKEGEAIMDKVIDVIASDGTRRTIMNSAIPIFNEYKTVASVIIVNQDITKLMQDEEKLRKTLSELERSNRELEQFAYVASHDLQEPLRMVASFTQLLSRKYHDKLDKNADEYIDFAVEGAKRMQNIIHDLLEFSRASSDNNLEIVNCNSALDKAMKNLEPQIMESCAIIRKENLPVLRAKEGQIVQLFENLLSNAMKFRGGKTPEIYIGCTSEMGEWLFWVKDNGIGIDPQFKDRIFSIFQRLHDRSEYPGTGIGLSLCKKIVENFGGRIWVESKMGEGSTFYFTIPK
ncbi:MAG TPA: ATP-binding protein [Ignavibacteriales bacterium]|nr:ATP-binding protein [Ignavibacteriales bacterium]